MFCRKSFLIFVLAFAALTFGLSHTAMAQWDWDWGDLPPGFIDGGSTNLVYTCDQGQGTNTLTQGPTSDTYVSEGDLFCTFTGQVKGTDIPCHYEVTWTGDLASCVDTKAGAVVTVKSTCDNPNVSGSLSCPAVPNLFVGANDLLGISSKSECQRVFGRNANTLFTQATFVGQSCSQVNNDPKGLKLGGLTETTTNLCHSDGGLFVDCIAGSQTNTSNSSLPNLAVTQCTASPQTWNIDCSGNKDKGNGTVCYVNGAPDVFSFDPTKLNAATAMLNGVEVDSKKSCIIKDCNGDGIPDFQCTFPTCSGNTATAGDGTLTMITNFTGGENGLTCTTTVATSGQGS